MNKNQKKRSLWLASLKHQTIVCGWCKKPKPNEQFWDSKKRKPAKVCLSCLSHRRGKSGPNAKPVEKYSRVAYFDYLKSTTWKSKRQQYWNSSLPHECYVCVDPWTSVNTKELHHRTYERLFNERLNDLVPVCRECHQQITDLWNARKAEKSGKTLWEVTDEVREYYRNP